jgi:hypothetical protein
MSVLSMKHIIAAVQKSLLPVAIAIVASFLFIIAMLQA